jgi:protein TonB
MAQGGMRFCPALGLSLLLHGALLFALYTPWPLPGGGGGGIAIDLVSLPGAPSGNGEGASSEGAANPAPPEAHVHSADAFAPVLEALSVPDAADEAPSAQEQEEAADLSEQSPLALVRPPEKHKSRSGQAQPKKNPAKAAPQREAKNSASAGSKDAAQGDGASGPDSAVDGQGASGLGSDSAVEGQGGDVSFSAGFASGEAGSGLGAGFLIPLVNPKPVYPELARQRGQEGRVVLLAHVDERGAVEEVHVQSGSGYDLLDRAAVNAVRRWRFKPARRAGADVAGRVLVPVEFHLRR